ncbi:MAG: response regulator transcription factor [Methylomonas sp.]|jgi:DNA-binding NarL/FixJ family response regulator|uniref:response regulator n=1 Tax=Methylomonas sp. TaxID=418 RepID=UPI0025CFD894|nr:response regulator transcription factor [Methylomonas sp.]MCK9605810.1 response regulator transcription factor [Methylomonas sp.]
MISILLVDDHAIVREGYRGLLSKQSGLQVVAEAGDALQAYQMFKQCRPDLVITDISLPGSSGLELIYRIKQRCTRAKILVFSMHQNPAFAEQAVRAGALGYVSKSSEPEVLLRAILDVSSGQHVLSPDIAQLLALEKLGSDRIALQTLTVREFEILRLLMDGQNHDDIANLLSISTKTVGNCHYLIKSKLGVASDIALTKLAIKLNVLDLLALSGPVG